MKKILKIIGAIFVVLIVIGLLASRGGDKSSVREAFKEGQEKGGEVIKGEFKDQKVTEESVKSALANLEDILYRVMTEKEITQVEVLDNAGTEDVPDDKVVHAYFKPKSVWDEKHTLGMTAGTAVAVMKRLFVHPKITSVTVWVEGDFIDKYGKSSTETAVRVGLDKPTADKIEWENFRDMVLVDYNKLFDIADTYVHPAIRKTR